MRTFRSYLVPSDDDQPVEGQSFELKGEEAHHLLRVLRIREGEAVILFDGEGRTWNCRFLSGKGSFVQVEVLSSKSISRSGPQVFLAQCLSKTKAMELLMRHATELGIAGVIPLHNHHAEVRLEGGREQKRLERLRSIAIEACKQSGNVFVPQVFPVQTVMDWLGSLESAEAMLRLTASLEADARPLLGRLDELGHDLDSITWLVGPEGDLSKEEYLKARDVGFIPVRLAGQVLRVETAALYALAATDAYFQDKRLGLLSEHSIK